MGKILGTKWPPKRPVSLLRATRQQEMSTEDRAAFIQSMVQGLADRLKDDPDDLDGWLQLGRAYSVLGNEEGAKDAYQNAAALSAKLPETDPRKAIAAQALGSLTQ